MRRWVALVVLAAVTSAGLSGCDPALPAGDRGALISVQFNAEGGAEGDIFLDAHVRPTAELTTLGRTVAPLLFPRATGRTVSVDDNRHGFPFVVIRASGVYEPRRAPSADLDTRSAVAWLLANGSQTVDVEILAPYVPTTGRWIPPAADEGRFWQWDGLTAAAGAPSGTISMSPRPWRGILPLAVTVGALVLLVVGGMALRRRRRILAAGAALGVLACGAVVVMIAGGAQGENLGVAGYLSGVWLTLTSALPLLLLPAGLVALALFAASLALAPPAARPAGWLPPPD